MIKLEQDKNTFREQSTLNCFLFCFFVFNSSRAVTRVSSGGSMKSNANSHCKMRLGALFIFLTFTIATVCSIRRDDLVVSDGDQLQYLNGGRKYQTLTLNSYNASKLSALAYDVTTRNLFFSDLRHLHGHIFSVNLDDESPRSVTEIVEKNDNETVESMTYDPVDKMLLWVDGFNKSIRRIGNGNDDVQSDEKAGIEVIHFLNNEDKPRGLVSDPCKRMLYWTNILNSRPTIERSFLNGSHRQTLIETDLLRPILLDLDVMEQMLYWAESLRNGYFHIERSFVNGTGRETFFRGLGQIITSLAVGDDFVYWSDYNQKKVWSLRKDKSSRSPLSLGTFRNPLLGLVIIRNQPLNCTTLLMSESLHQAESFVEQPEIITIAVGLTVTCLILIAIVTILIFRVWKSMSSRRSTLVYNNKNEDDTLPFHYFDDYSNSYAMVEKEMT